MSVIQSKRDEAETEFLIKARELQAFTIQKCVSAIPKRYTFFLAQNIAQLAANVFICVKSANSIYPTNPHEVQMRRDYFIKANTNLQSLVSQVELANEIIGFEGKVMEQWSALMYAEARLISGIMKKDRARYKDIK